MPLSLAYTSRTPTYSVKTSSFARPSRKPGRHLSRSQTWAGKLDALREQNAVLADLIEELTDDFLED